jgi:hypothetical protein
MAMKLLAFHDQFVANLPADDEKDDLGLFYIIQHSEITRMQFIFSERILPKTFYRF